MSYLPSYRQDGLEPPATSFASPTFSAPGLALDANHENAKNFRFAPRPAGPMMRQPEAAAPSSGGQQEQRQPERQEQPEPAEPSEAPEAIEPDEPRPARATGRVFAGRDVAENMTDLAMEAL